MRILMVIPIVVISGVICAALAAIAKSVGSWLDSRFLAPSPEALAKRLATRPSGNDHGVLMIDLREAGRRELTALAEVHDV
jgi:hypothetical protein